MAKPPEPRSHTYLGMASSPHLGLEDTWLEPESLCYPKGGMTRRCRAKHVTTGKLVVVKCGIPDTMFSISCVGGYVTSIDGVFLFHPVSQTTRQAGAPRD